MIKEFTQEVINKNLSILDDKNIDYHVSEITISQRKTIIYFDNGKTIIYQPHSGHFHYKRRRYQTKTAYGVVNFIKKNGLNVIEPVKQDYTNVGCSKRVNINYDVKRAV